MNYCHIISFMEENFSIRKIVAKNVKKYRKLNNLTQENLAEAANISNTYVANIECGQTWVSDKTLEKIAVALHIDIYLLFLPDLPEKNEESSVYKREEIISYLNKREKELGTYIKNFFSETFSHILKD